MEKVFKTYRFKLMPDKEQEILLAKHFGCVRVVYNHFLNERIEQYKKNKRSDNYHAQALALTQLKKQEDRIWLNEVNSQTLQFALKSLDTAFVNFYKNHSEFPRFKSKRHKNTFTIPQSGKIEGTSIKIPKFKKGIKTKFHREVRGEIGKMTITRTPTGKYFVCIFTEQEIEQLPKLSKQVGIDLGIKDFVITSEGEKFKNNRYTKKYSRELKKSGMKTCFLIEYIADASWGTFVNLLHYKCHWYGRELIKIDRFFPCSKTCNACGWIKQDLNLSDREWTCGNGHHLDRDLNAAKNILTEGLKRYRQGLSITKAEDDSVYYGSISDETRSPSIAVA